MARDLGLGAASNGIVVRVCASATAVRVVRDPRPAGCARLVTTSTGSRSGSPMIASSGGTDQRSLPRNATRTVTIGRIGDASLRTLARPRLEEAELEPPEIGEHLTTPFLIQPIDV